MTDQTKPNFIYQALSIPIVFVVLMWSVHIGKIIAGNRLSYYGVYPRDIDGLKGILFAPLIHGDFQHLISNTVPFFVLSSMIFIFYRRVAVVSFVLIYLLTGAAVWMFGREVFHIGMSGVVYGLLAFVFWNGIFRRNLKSIILALVVLVAYSGYFFGIVPNQEGISWESHLLGGVVGIIVSFLFKGAIERDEEPKPDPWAQERLEGEKYFFQRNVFDQTIEEKRQAEILRRQQERDNLF